MLAQQLFVPSPLLRLDSYNHPTDARKHVLFIIPTDTDNEMEEL